MSENIRTGGMRRLIRRNFTIVRSTVSTVSNRTDGRRESGMIIINSSSLKGRVGEEVRVIVYGRRKRFKWQNARDVEVE